MLKPFCDRCGSECFEVAPNTRRFDKLDLGGAFVGLEVIPLYGGSISESNHLCDNCMPELLLKALITFTNSPTVHNYSQQAIGASTYIRFKASLEAKVEQLNKIEGEIRGTIKTLEDLISAVPQDRIEDVEKAKQLTAQLVVIKTAKEAREKQLEAAQAKQAEIDSKEYPDYVDRVAVNQHRRASK